MEQATESSEVAVNERLSNLFGGDEPEETDEAEESEADEGEVEEADEGTEEDAAEESEEDEPEADESTDSVEVDGKVIDLPAGTPPEVVEAVTAAIAEKERSLKADYTQKTQEAAEMRKAATAYYEQTQQQAQFNQQHIAEIAQLQALQANLQEYDQIDWNALADQDPVQFLKYQHQRTELRESVAQMHNGLNNKSQQMQQQRNEEQRNRIATGLQVLAKDLPGWGTEYAGRINDFGQKAYGFSKDELSTIVDPRMVKVLNDAMKYQELKTKGVKAKQVTPAPQKFVKPGAKVSQSTESERRARANLKNTGQGAASLIAKFIK